MFGGPPREAESELTQREMDLAASIQKVTEEVIIKLAKGIAKEDSSKKPLLSGWCCFKLRSNGVLLREKVFKNIWIQPAAGDAGGALGAALGAYFIMLGKDSTVTTT